MDGVTLLLNVTVGIWLFLGLHCLACWYVPAYGRAFYADRDLKVFLVLSAVILALAGLMRFVRMEE